MKWLTLALAALAACTVPGAHAHTYFKADMKPFGSGIETQPGASATLDFLTHAGEAWWTLNVTGVVNMTAAKLVYGPPSIYGEQVVTYLNVTADGGAPLNGDLDADGIFDASNFTAPYNTWTMNGLMANAGLDHLWAVVTNDAPYKNVILAAPLEHYQPEGH